MLYWRPVTAVLVSLLVWAPPARALTVLVTKGSQRRPLFTELYRQSVIAAARYGRGFDAIDAALTPNATAPIVVAFFDEGQILRISLRIDQKQAAFAHVPYPEARWPVLADIENSRKIAEGLVAKIPGAQPPAAHIATDMARAQLGYQTFDLPALVWVVNTLGAAQRGKAPDPDALKLMSASYGWMGHWLNGLPTNHAKLFHARALALAALAGKLSGDASPELALALAHAGRQADALFVLARSTPSGSETAAVADALSRQDSTKAEAGAKGSRQWLWTLAFTSMYNENEDEETSAYRELIKDPSDFPAIHMYFHQLGQEQRDTLTAAYLELPEALAASGDFLDGRRPVPPSTLSGASTATIASGWKGIITASQDAAHDDVAEEISHTARAGILLDAAVDAASLRMGGVMGRERAELKARAAGLTAAHPWGFLPQLIGRTEKIDAEEKEFGESLARAPFCYGGLRAIFENFHDEHAWNVYEWMAPREGELDDVTLDTGFRSRIKDAPVGPERGAELDPFSSGPYMLGGEQTIDAGLTRLGERPPLLRRKLSFMLQKRPFDAAATAATVDRLLAVGPSDWRARSTKAALLMLQNKPHEAAAVWREFIAREPGSPAATYAASEMSWIYAVAGDVRRSRALALAAAASYSREGLLALARAYEDSGRYDMAEQVYAMIEYRYGGRLAGTLMAKFYLRTGDPRGYGLVSAGIPKFFAHQQSAGTLTDEDHLQLLDSFLMTEQWDSAFDLLNQVVVPRWHPHDARYMLWLAVTWLKTNQGRSDGIKILEQERPGMDPKDSLTAIVDVFIQSATVDEALSGLNLDPSLRSRQLYMLAQYLTLARHEPERATTLLASVVALKQYDSIEYYLALKALDRIPSYPARVLRQLSAITSDLAWSGARIARWRTAPSAKKNDGRK